MTIEITRRTFTHSGVTAEGRNLCLGERSVFIPDTETVSNKAMHLIAEALLTDVATVRNALQATQATAK